jgi:hypothetical protein
MRLPPALVETLWKSVALPLARPVHTRVALLAWCLMSFAVAPAQAQITGISATPNCDAVTGLTTGGVSVTVTDANGLLIAAVSLGLLIPFEQPSNNTFWTVNGSTTIIPSNFAPQCAPPLLAVTAANFNARVMQGGLGSPPSGVFAVGNAGGGMVYLAATPYYLNGVPFFSLSALPPFGPNGGTYLTVTLSAQAFSLPPGRYAGSIDFSNAAQIGLVVTRPVQLTVVRSVAHDFNGDGFSDLVWRDSSGNLAIWLMQGNAVIATGGAGPVPPSWSLVGQRDFNGDTKTDWISRDTSGDTTIWYLNGTQVSAPNSLGNIPTNWTVIATGDFNGDGKGDILWRDNSGNVAVWLMNGAQVVTSAGIANVPATWSVIGTGDFNGDGTTDLLWQDSAGNTAIWFMGGTQVLGSAGLGVVPLQWQLAGTGDFDGDGFTDLLWHDTSGDTAMWLMNGTAVAAAISIGNVPTVWSVAEIGDYNGDGYSDIFWRDTSGNTAIWFMDGPTVIQNLSLGNVPVNWTVQSAGAE